MLIRDISIVFHFVRSKVFLRCLKHNYAISSLEDLNTFNFYFSDIITQKNELGRIVSRLKSKIPSGLRKSFVHYINITHYVASILYLHIYIYRDLEQSIIFISLDILIAPSCNLEAMENFHRI